MGFLGGWTTYSAFAVDVAVQWMRGERMRAVALACATLAGAPVIYVMVRAAVGAVG
jgi:fluoride ion exporter CrcB/FEX